MKTPSDNIYKLIRSMTAAEKRYFKRHYSSDKSLLTELFDFINGMEVYNEHQIKLHFKSSNLAKNLKVYKVQLFELLLKSLTSHHNKRNVKSKIRMGLEEIEVLIEKELFSFAQSRIKKLKNICLKYEEFSYLIPLLETEYILENFYTVSSIKSTVPDQFEEIDEYTSVLSNLFHLRSMYSRTIDHYNHREVHQLSEGEKERYQNFIHKVKKENSLEKRTVKEQVFINQIIANIEFLLNKDIQKKVQLLKSNLNLFEQNPHFIDAHPRYYFATLYNYLNACCNIQQFDQVNQGIQQIKQFVDKYSSIRRNLLFVYFLEIRSAYLQSEYKLIAEKLESKIQTHIKKYDQEHDFLTAQIYNILIHNHLILQNPQQGHFYLRRLQIIAKQLNFAYEQYTQLIEFIGHYDTNDFPLIDKMINSFKRKSKKNKSYSPFFISFLELLEKLIKNKDKDTTPQLAKSYAKKWKSLKDDPVMNLMEEYTLETWLEMLHTGQSFSEIKTIR